MKRPHFAHKEKDCTKCNISVTNYYYGGKLTLKMINLADHPLSSYVNEQLGPYSKYFLLHSTKEKKNILEQHEGVLKFHC